MPAAFAVLPSPFVLDLAIRLAAPTWIADGQAANAGLIMDAINDKLRDEDVDLSDDDAFTDHSTDCSPINSPSSSAMKTPLDTPKATQAKVSQPTEPERPARRKRKRMSEEERKVRHREVQRQFMKRKRARIAVLRKVQSNVEKQLRLVRILQEVEMLKKENDTLKKQYDACENSEALDSIEAPPTKRFEGLVFSVPVEETQDEFLLNDCDWDDLFNVLAEDASMVVDVDSETISL